MNKTSIPWVLGPDSAPGYTWNPAIGCKAISPGCAHCYAARLAGTRLAHLPQYRGLTHQPTENGHWTGEVRFFPEKLAEPLRLRKPAGIFVCDMGDLFHDGLTNEQIAAVFGVMAACPQHRFYVLTKRPQRMLDWFRWVSQTGPSLHPLGAARGVRWYAWNEANNKAWAAAVCPAYRETPPWSWPLPNVFIGTTIENGDAWRVRALALAEVPAAVHFWSCEPLLEHIDVLCPRCDGDANAHRAGDGGGCSGDFPDWVIVGGESGPKARPFHVAWARSIVEQCRSAGTSVFVKQIGARPVFEHYSEVPNEIRDRAGADPAEWPADLRVRQIPEVRR